MTTTNTAITSVIPTDNSLTNQTSTNHISPIAVPSIPAATVQSSTIIQPTNKITLKQVHQDLKEYGVEKIEDDVKGKLLKIQECITSDNFDNLNSDQMVRLEMDNTLNLGVELGKLSSILCSKNHSEYRSLIKTLFAQELRKFLEAELADGAVIMRTLIKIKVICEQELDSVNHALSFIIMSQDSLANIYDDIEDTLKALVQYKDQDLMELIYQKLGLLEPFKARHVDDDSSEEHGFFASLKHAFWHPKEFFIEKIWGKKKLNGSFNAVHEIESQYKTSSEGQGSAIKYFEDAIKWLFNLGGLFSTHERGSNITTADTPPLEPAGEGSDTEGEEGS